MRIIIVDMSRDLTMCQMLTKHIQMKHSICINASNPHDTSGRKPGFLNLQVRKQRHQLVKKHVEEPKLADAGFGPRLPGSRVHVLIHDRILPMSPSPGTYWCQVCLISDAFSESR